MTKITKAADMQAILSNPTLYPNALLSAEAAGMFPWHNHAHNPRSSQIFCMSAFGAARLLPQRNNVMHAFLSSVWENIKTDSGRARHWDICMEVEDPALLGEQGETQCTSIDVVLGSSKEVICVESKFLTDAKTGLGGCSQVNVKKGEKPKCDGFYGPGSDTKTTTAAWCRLETWEGTRAPRLYWALGKQFFRPSVFAKQDRGSHCQFRGGNYQLMRTFLTAAVKGREKDFFGAIVICPAHTSELVKSQVDTFKKTVLLPKFEDNLQFATYETYIRCLAQAGGEAGKLADFLTGCISREGRV